MGVGQNKGAESGEVEKQHLGIRQLNKQTTPKGAVTSTLGSYAVTLEDLVGEIEDVGCPDILQINDILAESNTQEIGADSHDGNSDAETDQKTQPHDKRSSTTVAQGHSQRVDISGTRCVSYD